MLGRGHRGDTGLSDVPAATVTSDDVLDALEADAIHIRTDPSGAYPFICNVRAPGTIPAGTTTLPANSPVTSATRSPHM